MRLEDVAQMALVGEFISRVLDEYIDLLVEKNDLTKPTDDEVKALRAKILADMQQKYPTAGITDKANK